MTTKRVRYREQQTLGKSDLYNEQAYRIAMRRRHNLAHHTWGIVEGLNLEPIESNLVLQPGIAIDGYGRELIVPSAVSLQQALNKLLENCTVVDIWLLYGLTATTPPQRGRWGCGLGRHSRWQEDAVLRLKPAQGNIDPRKPGEVPKKDWVFGPADTPPDDLASEWPVYLGTISLESSEMTIDMTRRPYAELVGESVSAPSGKSRMQVGSEAAGDKRRFAVQVADDDRRLSDRLVIDRNGDTSIQGNAILHDNLIFNEFNKPTEEEYDHCVTLGREIGKLKPKPPPGIEFEPLATEPAEAAPWQIYHVELENIEERKKKSSIHQLRLEIDNPGDKGDPKRNLFAIGQWDQVEFNPCLTVNADCTVMINGNLTVKGEIVESEIQADPNDPEFRDAIEARWMQGIGETGTKLFTGYAFSELDIIISRNPTNPVIDHEELDIIFTITNNGHLTLSDVTIYGSIIFNNGETETTTINPIKIGDLESGENSVTKETYPLTQAGKLDIIATVIGVSSTSAIISDWDSAEIDITDNLGPD